VSDTFIVSVGYERRSVEDLVSVLVDYGVRKLLDIREAPVSRRQGFSKRSLAARLDAAGIEYRHLRIAGNPHRRLREDIERCLQLYEEHLCENPQVVKAVAEEVLGQAVAVLCYERDHDDCHRSVLLDALAHEGHDLEVIRVE
jgi:uncharacterized protein (DUF488 family)